MVLLRQTVVETVRRISHFLTSKHLLRVSRAHHQWYCEVTYRRSTFCEKRHFEPPSRKHID